MVMFNKYLKSMHTYCNLNNCINIGLKVAYIILNSFIYIFPVIVEILLL